MKRATGSVERQMAADGAADLLDNPVLKQAHEAVREALVKRLIDGSATEPNTDHELANLLRASELYWRILRRYLRTGNVELLNEQSRQQVV